MEEKKDYNRHQQSQQKFYFNEDGKLVIETNKGTWVDGEKYVGIKGSFVCNSYTLCEIIKQFKGIQVEVDTRPEEQKFNDFMEFLHKQYKDAEKRYDELSTQKAALISELDDKMLELTQKLEERHKAICKFNALPWYKRMFKKIEIK